MRTGVFPGSGPSTHTTLSHVVLDARLCQHTMHAHEGESYMHRSASQQNSQEMPRSTLTSPRTPRGRLPSTDGSRSTQKKRVGFEAAMKKLESMMIAREGVWELFKEQDSCSSLGIICDSDPAAVRVIQHVIPGSPAYFW